MKGLGAYRIQICALLLAASALGGQTALPGLTVKDGQFYKDGQPFRGVGMNYFSCFIRITGMGVDGPKLENRDYVEGFRVLKEHEVPFVRFCAGGFWPVDWHLYQTDKAKYFELFDELVAEAEKQQLGLIPSLFWTCSTVPDLVDETLDQWGNPGSRTRAFMRQYTTEVVSRYKDSPAIWGWEFGNEWIHEADLPQEELGRGWIVPHLGTPAARTEKDKILRPAIHSAHQDFYETVRRFDATRPVFTGDALPRPAAWNNRHHGTWTPDTPAQWEEMLLADNSFDTLTVHLYYYRKDDRPRDGGVLGYEPEEQVDFLMQISRDSGKPLFIGEFGQEPSDAVPVEDQFRQVGEILQWITRYQVPLSALWNYDLDHPHHRHFNITEKNERADFLKMLRDTNRELTARCPGPTGHHAFSPAQLRTLPPRHASSHFSNPISE